MGFYSALHADLILMKAAQWWALHSQCNTRCGKLAHVSLQWIAILHVQQIITYLSSWWQQCVIVIQSTLKNIQSVPTQGIIKHRSLFYTLIKNLPDEILYNARSPLFFITGILTTQCYVNEALRAVALPFPNAHSGTIPTSISSTYRCLNGSLPCPHRYGVMASHITRPIPDWDTIGHEINTTALPRNQQELC